METRRTLLRAAAVLTLAVSIVGSSALAPSASAAPVSGTTDLHSVASKTKKEKSEKADKHNDNENESESSDGESGGGGLSDVPVVGGVVDQFANAEPEEIVQTAVQFAGVAADTVVPLVRGLIK